MLLEKKYLSPVFAASIVFWGLLNAAPARAAKFCLEKLQISPGQQATSTRDGKYRHDGRCYTILECPDGILTQTGARLFSCRPKPQTACTYTAYAGGACSYKQYLAYQTRVASTAPPSCDNKLTVKVGQGFKTNAQNRLIYANTCYGSFECTNGKLVKVADHAYLCYAYPTDLAKPALQAKRVLPAKAAFPSQFMAATNFVSATQFQPAFRPTVLQPTALQPTGVQPTGVQPTGIRPVATKRLSGGSGANGLSKIGQASNRTPRGPREPICRYIDYSEGLCSYTQYVRDFKKNN